MGAARADLTLDQGSTKSWILSLTDDNGDEIDLSNCSVKATAKRNASASTGYDFSCTITDELLGKIQLKMLASVSSTMELISSNVAEKTKTVFSYDVFVTFSDQQPVMVLEGTLTVNPKNTEV